MSDIVEALKLKIKEQGGSTAGIHTISQSIERLDIGGGGLSHKAKLALLACFQKVAWIDDQGQTYYDNLYDALFSSAVSISATFTPGSHVFYETDSIDALKPYLVVMATFPDSSVEVVTDYILTGSMAVGPNTITVRYHGLIDTFDVTVQANPAYITAVFTQPTTMIYTDDALDVLKNNLVVTYFEEPETEGTVLTDSEYTLSGVLTKGVSSITVVAYNNLTDNFNVNVAGIGNYEYASDLSDWLMPDSTVTYNDGKITMYSTTGSQNYNTNCADVKRTLWDTVKNKMVRCRLNMQSPDWTGDASTTVPRNLVNIGLAIYENANISSLAQRLRWNNKISDVISRSSYVYEFMCYMDMGSFPGGPSTSTTADSTVGIQIYNLSNNTVILSDASVVEIFPDSLSVYFDTGMNTILDSNTLNDLRQYLIVEKKYADGSKIYVKSDSYSLSGSLNPGENTITVTADDVSATFTVTVEHDSGTRSLTASYTPSETVYTTTLLDDLKNNLVVTYYARTGAAGVILSDSDYTLSGSLQVGQCAVTVNYKQLTSTFNVTAVSGLPSGYTKYDYISCVSSGNKPQAGLIKLNTYNGLNTLGATFDYRVTVDNLAGQCIFGRRAVPGPTESYAFYEGVNRLGYHLYGNDTDPAVYFAPFNVMHHVVYTNTSESPSYISIDGRNRVAVNWKNDVTLNLAPTILTNAADDVSNASMHSDIEVGRIRLFNLSNVCVGDYVVAKNSSNVVGMYDLIGHTFYTSATASYCTIGNSSCIYNVGNWE